MKVGVLYLLKADLSNGTSVYKYGATRNQIRARIYWANREYYKATQERVKFKECFTEVSKDVFASECEFKRYTVDNSLNMNSIFSEFFLLDGIISELDIKKEMISLCKDG